ALLARGLADEEALKATTECASHTTTPAEALAHGLLFLFIDTVHEDNHARAEPGRVCRYGNGLLQIEGYRASHVTDGEIASRKDDQLPQKHVVAAVAAKHVCNRCDLQ